MNIKVEKKDGLIVAEVEGNINSANAGELEAALKDCPGDADGVVIDASGMEYISSAGLRVILNTKKKCGAKIFRVINVSNDVKSIFDVTGFSEIMEIVPASRTISVEGCDMIGSGACGECFRIDDETIVKLYYPRVSDEEIETEKALAKKAFVLGVPTAISYDIVRCDGRKGVIYELIKSKTISELIREDSANKEKYLDLYADVCKKIHSIHTSDPDIPSFKEINKADIKKIIGITDEEREYLYKFIDLVPDDDTCIHGDLNINNIMVENGECVLIDMGEFSTGTPMFDISRIVFSMHSANVAPDEMYQFYKMKGGEVESLFEGFIERYFGCDLETAIKTVPGAEWLMPLTWFRCCTSMIRGDRWPEEKVNMAKTLLRERLIPFVKERAKQ